MATPQSVLLESRALSEAVVPLDSKSRLAALENLEILDAPQERNFELLTELANSLLGTPVSLITLVTHDRQFFVSSDGLQEPWAARRETPLSHSFCQHVVKRNEPLVIGDAREHPLVCDNLAIPDLGVAAYLGVPLVHDDQVLGSFCVINGEPREWTNEDLGLLRKLASLTASELSNRKAAARKQFELENRLRQSQKMEAIGQLTTGIAHDFNNVLFGIKICTDLLKRELRGTRSIAHAVKIDSAIDVAKGIVQQLLTWSRPDLQYVAKQLSLAEIVDESFSLLSTTLSPSVDIVFDRPGDPCLISGDMNQIQQVLLNLCTNANHAMRETGGQIVVSVRTVELGEDVASGYDVEAGEYVKLQISDQGHGIPPELLERIHDPYFTTKPVGEGSGLGLWTVFGIANRHNAKIRVESEQGQGTTFAILFPVSPEVSTDPYSPKVQTESASQSTSQTVSAKLLVVEDDWIIAEGLEQLFTHVGYEVSCFTDSREALEFFLKDPEAIDIIVTDRAMPNVSGDELVAKCKAARSSVPIIVCSGFVDKFADGEKKSIGADAYCLKPYDTDDLCSIVANLLSDAGK